MCGLLSMQRVTFNVFGGKPIYLRDSHAQLLNGATALYRYGARRAPPASRRELRKRVLLLNDIDQRQQRRMFKPATAVINVKRVLGISMLFQYDPQFAPCQFIGNSGLEHVSDT